MVHVIAIITAKPGLREAMLAEVDAVKAIVRAEDGCIEYQPTIDTPNVGDFQTEFGEDTFVVIEKWANMETLRAHARSKHMAEYASKVKDLMANRTVHVMSPVPA